MSLIELVLKSPTDRIAPYTIKCNSLWTVKQLKENIKEVYPSKPKVESQKVIYVGKLLKDDQILKNIFEPDSSTIVHFICQSSLNEAEKKVNENLNKQEITPDKNPDLYKEYQNYISNYYASTSQSLNTMNHYHQMMWMNQAYMHSYANYYAQFVNKSDNVKENNQIAISETQVTHSIPQDTTAQNQENQPNNDRGIDVANPAVAAGENGMQNMMAAAFGGLMGDAGEDENDGDVEPRDILHYFYILVRFGLLLLICYYYSSVVSVVTTLMLFFVFFGVNLIRRNQNNQAQQAVPMAAPPVTPVVLEGEVDQPPITTTGDQSVIPAVDDTLPHQSTAESSPVLPEELPTITERIKQVATTSLQFVLTFFVTLFPEPIAHIDIN